MTDGRSLAIAPSPSGIGHVAIRLLVLVALFPFAAQSSPAVAQSDDGSPEPSVSLAPLVDVVRDDLFELSITTPRANWVVGEPIEVIAKLSYVGEAAETVVTGSGSGIVGFGIEQLDGPVDNDPGWRLSARRYPFGTGDGLTIPFQKSGGFDADDPMAPFWREWFDDPDVRPPAGTYRMFAEARYRTAESGSDTTLTASVTVAVVPEMTVSSSPSPASVGVAPVPTLGWARTLASQGPRGWLSEVIH